MGISFRFSALISIAVLSAIITGCSRPSKDSSKVVIQLPQDNASQKISALGDEFNNFVSPVIDPGGYENINCYLVAVHAADSVEMQRNSCGNTDRLGFNKVIDIGPWEGGTLKGGSMEISVPSGPNRTFYLIGAYTSDDNACKDLKSSFNLNKTSKFYIIGKAANVNLDSANVNVSIDVNYDPNSYFEDCIGPDFGLVNKIPSFATKILVSKKTFPETYLRSYVYDPVEISLVDEYGRLSTLPYDLPLNLQSSLNSSSGYTSNQTWDDYTTALSNVGGANSFTIEKGKSSVSRYFRAPYSGNYFYKALRVNPAVTVSALESPELLIPTVYTSANIYELIGPRVVRPNECYRYYVNIKNIGSGFTVAAGNTHEVLVASNNSNAVIYTSEAACLGNAPSTISFTQFLFSDDGRATFYAKFGNYQAGYNTHSITLSQFEGGGVISSSATVPIVIGTARLLLGDYELQGFTKKLVSNTCNGPFYVQIQNGDQTGLKLQVNAALIIDPTNSKVKAYPNASCATGTPKNFNVPKGTNIFPFYLKVDSDYPAGTPFNIKVKGTDLPLLGRFFEKEFLNFGVVN